MTEQNFTLKEMMIKQQEQLDAMKTQQEKNHDIQLQILQQAKLTNGRVTLIEKKSIGLWVANNPLRFAVFCTLTIALLISDIRHPLFTLLAGIL